VLDLHATLLDLAHIEPPQANTHSVSLLASPEVRAGRDFFISEMLAPATTALLFASKRYPDLNWNPWMRRYRAVEKDDHKFTWSSDGRHELYDLSADPGEHRNVYPDEPEQAKRLQETLEDWLASFPHYDNYKKSIEQTRPLTPEQIQRLRALGYMQ
jgi:hypothetical protein